MTVNSPERDTVLGLQSNPAIVSISDIHGYLEPTQSALLLLSDHPNYEPIVSKDEEGRLHWAENDYVLVFNGDLIDRGPSNEAVLELVGRLIDQAPPGRIRVTLGNHEALILTPCRFQDFDWYSIIHGLEQREEFLRQILAGHIIAAYRGYNFTYTHAGSPEPYDVSKLNDSLQRAANELLEATGSVEDCRTQHRILDQYNRILGTGKKSLKGPGAGLIWLDLAELPPDAPPQIVGHTRHKQPVQKGNIICQDVILDTRGENGGESVIIETSDSLIALTRESDGGISQKSFVLQ